jgi:SulP family sulfate permease
MIYFRHFDTVNWWNTIVSIVSIIIIAITPRFSKKIPGSLIAIIVVTASGNSDLMVKRSPMVGMQSIPP